MFLSNMNSEPGAGLSAEMRLREDQHQQELSVEKSLKTGNRLADRGK